MPKIDGQTLRDILRERIRLEREAGRNIDIRIDTPKLDEFLRVRDLQVATLADRMLRSTKVNQTHLVLSATPTVNISETILNFLAEEYGNGAAEPKLSEVIPRLRNKFMAAQLDDVDLYTLQLALVIIRDYGKRPEDRPQPEPLPPGQEIVQSGIKSTNADDAPQGPPTSLNDEIKKDDDFDPAHPFDHAQTTNPTVQEIGDVAKETDGKPLESLPEGADAPEAVQDPIAESNETAPKGGKSGKRK